MILNYYLKMIDLFCDWFEGTWENKVQAFSQPSKFAMVRLIHTKVPGTDYMYYGEQAYNFSLSRPYRQFIVEAFEENGRIILKNYDFDKVKYQCLANLDQIKYDEGLTYKENCDMIVVYDPNENQFVGSLDGCKCLVPYKGKETFVQNEAILKEDSYRVVDKGYLVGTTTQVWGGRYGHFEFQKTPL